MTSRVWTPDGWITVPVTTSGGEAVVTPNVNGLVYRASNREQLLLQRRDKPGEAVWGRLELPGGRWRAGETAGDALAREVLEETGIEISEIVGIDDTYRPHDDVGFELLSPAAVVVGVGGAYPSLHVVLECQGDGEPRPLPGETAEPAWWDVAEVRRLMADDPEAFVWHGYAMLSRVL